MLTLTLRYDLVLRIAFAGTISFLFSGSLLAQGEGSVRGLAVTATAEVPVRPDWVVARVRMVGQSEELPDAKKLFHDQKRRFTEALAALKWPELTLVGPGPKIGLSGAQGFDPWGNPMEAMEGGDQGDVQFSFTELLDVKVTGLSELAPEAAMERLSSLLLTVKTAGHALYGVSQEQLSMWGMNMGQDLLGRYKPALEFGLSDTSAVESEAELKAIQSAKEKAKQLAKACGAELGKVTSFELVPGRKSWDSFGKDAIYAVRVRMVFDIL
jgi:hypothetical protein